jgi:hypothetical protein
LSLATAATALSVDEAHISSYDLCGRPYALVREGWTWRRSLDGRLAGRRTQPDGTRSRQRLSAQDGSVLVEEARLEAAAVLDAVEACAGLDESRRREARRRLRLIVSMDAAALANDAERFTAICRPVPILPPDQYLALVAQITEGCSWNACTFCNLYRGTSFRVRSRSEVEAHLEALVEYFGESLALRRKVFVADANALCVPHAKLLGLLEALASVFPMAPPDLSGHRLRGWLRAEPRRMAGFASFVDALTGSRKSRAQYRQYADLGLRRVYVGLETGDPGLHARLGKPADPQAAIELVHALHGAQIGVGVIVLLGVGGEASFEPHARRTGEVLTRMRLGHGELVYFSEYLEDSDSAPGLPGTRSRVRLGRLDLHRCQEQQRLILEACQPADPTRPPVTAPYDLRDFVY